MRAIEVLDGYGDAALGEWEESGENAYHIKRRLTPEEQAGIGDACDIRGTREGEERLTNAWRWLHPVMRDFAKDEVREFAMRGEQR